MKFILPVITLIVGFGIGWYFSGKRIQENVKAVMPEELHESVEAVAEYLGPMTEEEVNKTMEMIRTMSQQIVDQMDRETLWRYMTTIRLKSIFEEQGPEAFIEHTEYETNHFLEQYEEGMELGEWQEVADNLYTRIKTEENHSE